MRGNILGYTCCMINRLIHTVQKLNFNNRSFGVTACRPTLEAVLSYGPVTHLACVCRRIKISLKRWHTLNRIDYFFFFNCWRIHSAFITLM